MSAFKISSLVTPHELELEKARFQFGERTEFVSLAELEGDPKQGSSTMGKIIIFEVLYYKKAPTNDQKGNQFFYSRTNTKLSNVSYDRMIVLRCLNSPPGLNICCILMGSSRNGRLFDQHLSARDTGGFAPGAIVCIENPSYIESWMGGQVTLPLLDVPNSFHLIKKEPLPPMLMVPTVEGSDRLHAFHYPRALLSIFSICFVDLCCNGKMCDCIGLYKDGRPLESCSCVTSISRLGNLSLLFDMKIMPVFPGESDEGLSHEDKIMWVRNFTSRSFTNNFLVDGVPLGITQAIVHGDHDLMNSVYENIMLAVDEINGEGGFSITGWVRRGYVKDEGAASVSAPGNKTTLPRVRSGEIHHRLTKISINQNSQGKVTDIGKFKTDLRKFYKEDTVPDQGSSDQDKDKNQSSETPGRPTKKQKPEDNLDENDAGGGIENTVTSSKGDDASSKLSPGAEENKGD